MSKWEGFALTMPIGRDTIIKGKYIVMLLLTFLGSGFSVIFMAVINAVLGKPNIFEGIQVCAGGAAVIILFYSITIPIITKLGVEKARILFFAVYIIPIFTVVFVGKAVENGNLKIPDSLIRVGKVFMENIYVIVPLVVILALAISYMVSINIYRKKDF
jgi:ABC-type transport system involved in multi-copper enzyme maturation permease subunit